MPSTDIQDWITVAAACRMSSLSRSSIYRLIARRKIQSAVFQITGNRSSRRISAQSIAEFLAR